MSLCLIFISSYAVFSTSEILENLDGFAGLLTNSLNLNIKLLTLVSKESKSRVF